MKNYLSIIALLCLAFAGCYKNMPPPATTVASVPEKKPHDHDHDEGPHGGVVAEWGDHEFHAEFTVDHPSKTATIYLLDEHARKAAKVDPQNISGVTLTLTNLQPPVTIELRYDAAKSSEKGIAFVGIHEALGKEMEFAGNISGTLNGKPYSGDFKEVPHHHDEKKP